EQEDPEYRKNHIQRAEAHEELCTNEDPKDHDDDCLDERLCHSRERNSEDNMVSRKGACHHFTKKAPVLVKKEGHSPKETGKERGHGDDPGSHECEVPDVRDTRDRGNI